MGAVSSGRVATDAEAGAAVTANGGLAAVGGRPLCSTGECCADVVDGGGDAR